MINKSIIIRRFTSVIIDHLSLTFTAMILGIPMLVYKGFKSDVETEPSAFFIIYAAIIWTVFLNKDIYFGRSLGKYKSNLQVLNFKTNEAANPFQCVVRNFFLVLWPIEMVVLIFSPSRRLGDMVAQTKVQFLESEAKGMNGQLLIPRAITVTVTLAFTLLLVTLIRI
jgi:hypothetical protein